MRPTCSLVALFAFTTTTSFAQYTTTVQAVSEISDGQPQAPTGAAEGFQSVTSYSAHPPYYTPPWADTATMPAFSAAPSSYPSSYPSSSSAYSVSTTSTSTSYYIIPTQPGTNYNTTSVPISMTIGSSAPPANNYTIASATIPVPASTSTFSLVSSSAVAAASTTGPSVPISSKTNAAVLSHIVGTWLALVAAGSVSAVLL